MEVPEHYLNDGDGKSEASANEVPQGSLSDPIVDAHRIVSRLRDEGLHVTRLSAVGVRVPCTLKMSVEESAVRKFVYFGETSSDGDVPDANYDIASLSWSRTKADGSAESIRVPINDNLLEVTSGPDCLHLWESERSADPRSSEDAQIIARDEAAVFHLKFETGAVCFEASTAAVGESVARTLQKLATGLSKAPTEANLLPPPPPAGEGGSPVEASGERRERTQAVVLRLACAKDEGEDEVLLLCLSHGLQLLEPLALKWRSIMLVSSWRRWCKAINRLNQVRMAADHKQWHLHARAHKDDDLQAWYHNIFHDELYRLKGPFWYKEAALQDYSHHPIKKATPADTPSSVLCTPDMTYSTMAATMYSIRELLGDPEYALFEKLTADGVTVMKHPRTGRPQKKLFQLSLVQGDMYLFMYLTWKGKHGTQGVELASVSRVSRGIDTDVLRKSAKKSKADCYFSLVLPDRSLDLSFDEPRECSVFHLCMNHLVQMERRIRDPHMHRWMLAKFRALCTDPNRASVLNLNGIGSVLTFLMTTENAVFKKIVTLAYR